MCKRNRQASVCPSQVSVCSFSAVHVAKMLCIGGRIFGTSALRQGERLRARRAHTYSMSVLYYPFSFRHR